MTTITEAEDHQVLEEDKSILGYLRVDAGGEFDTVVWITMGSMVGNQKMVRARLKALAALGLVEQSESRRKWRITEEGSAFRTRDSERRHPASPRTRRKKAA